MSQANFAPGSTGAPKFRYPDAYDSDSAADETPLEPPSPKAIPPRRIFTSTSSPPRYGHDSIAAGCSASHPKGGLEQKEADLKKSIEAGHPIDHPTAGSKLVVESMMSESILTRLRRGRDFARLSPERGINAATKNRKKHRQTRRQARSRYRSRIRGRRPCA